MIEINLLFYVEYNDCQSWVAIHADMHNLSTDTMVNTETVMLEFELFF